MSSDISTIGIDIAKDELEVATYPAEHTQTVDHDEAGIRQLRALCDELEPSLVVMEATGGLEVDLACQLHVAEVAFCVVNPRQVRDFAKATGRLAKTDKIDAHLIAHFGHALEPEPSTHFAQARQKLNEWVGRRRQISDMIVAETNRLKQSRCERVKESIETTLGQLREQKQKLESDIESRIQADPVLKATADRLRSAPGHRHDAGRPAT